MGNAVKHFENGKSRQNGVAEVARLWGCCPKHPNSGECRLRKCYTALPNGADLCPPRRPRGCPGDVSNTNVAQPWVTGGRTASAELRRVDTPRRLAEAEKTAASYLFGTKDACLIAPSEFIRWSE